MLFRSGLGQKRFIARLVEDKYLYRTSKNTLCAYSKYAESGKGYFALKECISRASDWGGVQVLVTPKGRDFFRRKYGTLQCPKRYRHSSGPVEDYAYDEGFCYKEQRREVK